MAKIQQKTSINSITLIWSLKRKDVLHPWTMGNMNVSNIEFQAWTAYVVFVFVVAVVIISSGSSNIDKVKPNGQV